MMIAKQFYSASNHGLAFNQQYRVGRRVYIHRGLDIKGFAEGADIPSWCAGVVVASGFDSMYGWYVTIQIAPRLFAHYCHMAEATPLTLWSSAGVGTTVGEVGSTGFAAQGPHLHTMLTTSRDLRSRAVDPLPFMLATPDPDDLLPQERTEMTSAYATRVPAVIQPADVDFLNGLVSSGPLVTRSGVGIYALCGDSPGTRANVQLTQLDSLGNAWAADHTGALDVEHDGLKLGKGVRWLDWPHFISTLKAYLTPISTPAMGAPLFDDDTIQKLASANAAAFFAEQKKAGN